MSPLTTSPPGTSPPATSPPATSQPTTEAATRSGTVNGCNTYGQNCEGNPLYQGVPGPGYDYRTEPKIGTVANGTRLEARCWAQGGTTWNYAASHNPPDYGWNPYESDIYFNVEMPGTATWGYIPDTYFVRDKANKLGLPRC